MNAQAVKENQLHSLFEHFQRLKLTKDQKLKTGNDKLQNMEIQSKNLEGTEAIQYLEIKLATTKKDLDDIEKVTPDVVKQAAEKLKPGKSDPVYSFSSDCIKVDSDRLAELLSMIFQSYLIHGHVTRFLLLATLVPIIKDKLGSINSSKNYRSIAISSLILKLIDWIIIILFGKSFGLNDLQFAYQPGVSTEKNDSWQHHHQQ